MPQPGKVKIQVKTMVPAKFHLTARSRFSAPTPMIAVVFVCVVETGIPVKVAKPMQKHALKHAAKP